jgi:hypothetical protein
MLSALNHIFCYIHTAAGSVKRFPAGGYSGGLETFETAVGYVSSGLRPTCLYGSLDNKEILRWYLGEVEVE